MDRNEYVGLVSRLKAETADLITQRQQIDIRLANLKQAMDSLTALVEEDSESESCESPDDRAVQTSLGLTDSVLDVLQRAGFPLSVTEIRDRLVRENKLDQGRYKNFLAVIHGTLHRLVVGRQVGFMEIGARTVYMFIPRATTESHRGRVARRTRSRKRSV